MNDNLENERGITIKTPFDSEDKFIEKEVIVIDEHTTLIYTKTENSTSVAIIGSPSDLLSKEIAKVLEADLVYIDTESIIGNRDLSELFNDVSSAEHYLNLIDLDYKELNFKYNYFEDKKFNRFIDKSRRTKSNKRRK